MKRILLIFIIFLFIKVPDVYAKPHSGQPVCIYNSDIGLNIISYSHKWDTEQKLEQIYNELLNNFHSNEINFLSNIYIYPNSPYNTNGIYYEATITIEDGRFVYGKDAYIEIFNGDKYTDISQIAPTLSHEYGHHFTYYYLVTYENKYSNQWYATEYAKIRQLDKYKQIDYGFNEVYVRKWDIAEIVSCDYVQLFGSKLAKKSVDYKDVTERIQKNIVNYYLNTSFNALPQENLVLPLAADVDGLYEYWLKLAGTERETPKLLSRPKPYIKNIEDVYFGDMKRYTISWDEIPDNNIYEYTVIMYPSGMPFFSTPIKTVMTGELMEANVGTDIKTENGEIYGLLEPLRGEYEIIVFIKDKNDFIFSSEILFYDFSTGLSDYNESTIKDKK